MSLFRGTLYMMVAQLVFLLSGYVIQVFLARTLGPADYGIFGVTIAMASLTAVILTSGMPQAAAKYISEDESNTRSVKNTAIRLQVALTIVVFLAYLLLSYPISVLLGDASLAYYLAVSSLMLPFYAFYSLHTSFLNGRRAYSKQASSTTIYSLGKMFGVFALVLLGFSVAGAVVGYAVGQVFGLIVGAYFFIKLTRTDAWKKKKTDFTPILIKYAVPIIIFSLTMTFLMSADLFFVKALLADNAQAGLYNAASTLARIPYFVLIALGTTLFPAISKSVSAKNKALTKNYISGSIHYLMIIIVPVALMISASSDNLLKLFYSSVYLPGGAALSILIFGLTLMTIFQILSTIISASGRPRVSMSITLLLVPVVVVANMLLIPLYGLQGAALATTITGLIGLLISGAYVAKQHGSFVSVLSLVRIVVPSLIIYGIASAVKVSGVLLIVEYVGLLVLYGAILVAIREIKRSDFALLKKLPVIGYVFEEI